MKRILMVPLGILAAVGILMMAGCGTPVNPLPNIQIVNLSANGSLAYYEANIYGPDIQVYSLTHQETAIPNLTAPATFDNYTIGHTFDGSHSQPNTGNAASVMKVSLGIRAEAPGTAKHCVDTFSYYTNPGKVYSTFSVSYNVRF